MGSHGCGTAQVGRKLPELLTEPVSVERVGVFPGVVKEALKVLDREVVDLGPMGKENRRNGIRHTLINVDGILRCHSDGSRGEESPPITTNEFRARLLYHRSFPQTQGIAYHSRFWKVKRKNAATHLKNGKNPGGRQQVGKDFVA